MLATSLLAVTACGENRASAGEGEAASSERSEEAHSVEWTQDYEEALAEAKESDRPLLVLFTGSDWCPPCIQIERNVLRSEEFAAFASENVVLMKADFLRRSPQPDEIVEQNTALSRQYPVQGFPTVILIEPDSGDVIGANVGYSGAPASAYVEDLKAALARRS